MLGFDFSDFVRYRLCELIFVFLFLCISVVFVLVAWILGFVFLDLYNVFDLCDLSCLLIFVHCVVLFMVVCYFWIVGRFRFDVGCFMFGFVFCCFGFWGVYLWTSFFDF